MGVLITGGGSGIGLAMAAEFLARGYAVAVCGRDSARLAFAKKRLPELLTVEADVANADDHQKLATFLQANVPNLNVLVNNAGIQQALDYRSPVAPAVIRQEIEINLFGPLALTAVVLPLLLRNPDPAVVNVTSGLAFCPSAAMPIYCASKAALHSFTMSLRHQLKGRVRVVELVPPMVASDLRGARGGSEQRPNGGANLDSPLMISAQAFAAEAVARFQAGETEVVVGIANSLRQGGESVFSEMNR
jgi:uncharacterized oxidoreductase